MSALAEQVVNALKTDFDEVYQAGYDKGKAEGGEEEIFFTQNGSMYVKNLVIPTDAQNGLNNYAYRYADKMETLDAPLLKAIWTASVGCFQYCTSLKRASLPQITKIGNTFFGGCTSLETIVLGSEDYPMNENGLTTFQDCTSLKNLQYIGVINKSVGLNSCGELTDESVQNVIDCLADMNGQTSQNISFHSNVKARLTEEQKATISAKNWVLG